MSTDVQRAAAGGVSRDKKPPHSRLHEQVSPHRAKLASYAKVTTVGMTQKNESLKATEPAGSKGTGVRLPAKKTAGTVHRNR